jgi:hypothetical protein
MRRSNELLTHAGSIDECTYYWRMQVKNRA